MPCYDGPNEYEEEAKAARKVTSSLIKEKHEIYDRLDKLTDMLCRLCNLLEEKEQIKMLPADIEEWWIVHKKLDQERKELCVK